MSVVEDVEKTHKCGKCGVIDTGEYCDHDKVFLCRDCLREWDVAFEETGLQAHMLEYKLFMEMWTKIFYAFVQNKKVPTWDKLIGGDTFVLS